ncbi:MAG: DUF378 domain-containing protein [Candidatus Pacebacteria bacterium]|nr:DUF378 domain-containing protein [Candidatus Paceibacterota bacterium]
MKGLHKISFILLIIGGLNWLVIGLLSTDYVMQILGGSIARIIYILVGLSAVVEIINHKSLCKNCDKGMSQM